MNARHPRVPESVERAASTFIHVVTWTVSLLGIGAGIMLCGLLASSMAGPRPAFDAPTTSALVAALALGVISTSLVVQRANLRREETRELDRVLASLREQVRQNPQFAQCWGARVSPAHVPEELFIHTAEIIEYWSRCWRAGLIGEARARALVKNFFDSQIPRMYWERNGSWPEPRSRAGRFATILDEEFLRAIRSGPPVRPFEAGDGPTTVSPEPDLPGGPGAA